MTAAATAQQARAVDFVIQNEGSIFLFTPLTDVANTWLAENIPYGATHIGPSLVVEHRYAADIAEGIINDGLVVR